MKKVHLLIIQLLLCGGSLLQTAFANETQVPGADRTARMNETKFGLFIHWRLHSQLGRGECVMNTETTAQTTGIRCGTWSQHVRACFG